jgi:hypothetical protein
VDPHRFNANSDPAFNFNPNPTAFHELCSKCWPDLWGISEKAVFTVARLLLVSVHLEIVLTCYVSSLKVGGNEKQWGSGRSQMLDNGLGPWRSRFIYNLNTHLLNKNHISFSTLSSKMNKRYFDSKWCGANNLARAHRSSLRQWRCGSNSQRKLWTRFEVADFFSCSGRVSFYAPNIRCANKLARYK